MTVVAVDSTTAEPDKARLNKSSKHYRISYVETSGSARVVESNSSLRASKSENTKPQRRDRIYPEGAKMVSRKSSKNAVDVEDLPSSSEVGGTPRKNRQKGVKPSLRIDTRASSGSWSKSDDETPRTVASTPSSATPSGVRGKRDLRSPGIRKSPTAQNSESAPIPDFITQTDRYGNASTPRSTAALESAQAKKNDPNGSGPDIYQVELDPCETLLDSIRLMCCCLLPEESQAYNTKDKGDEQHTDGSDDPSHAYEDRVRLLPKAHPDDQGKKCLVLDLDETLVHSSFRAVPGADFVIPVQIEDVVHFVYVAKRPGVDEFLIEMAKHYEIVIYTASLNKYADPLLDLLDPTRVIRARLFRESCVYYEGNYVKDLSLIDRDLSQAIIVDNSPSSYIFHPENAIDCSSFIDDPEDRELDQIGAFLAGIKDVKDVRGYCSKWKEWPNVDFEEEPQHGSSQ